MCTMPKSSVFRRSEKKTTALKVQESDRDSFGMRSEPVCLHFIKIIIVLFVFIKMLGSVKYQHDLLIMNIVQRYECQLKLERLVLF